MRKLRPEEDAFGQALCAACKGDEVFEVLERDDGFLDSCPQRGIFLIMRLGLQLSTRAYVVIIRKIG